MPSSDPADDSLFDGAVPLLKEESEVKEKGREKARRRVFILPYLLA
jgi:hypothetical protein